MKKILITIACLAFLASCGNRQPMQGLDLSNLDTSICPTYDFYQFATGGWQAANPIPDDLARFGTFDKLRRETQIVVLNMIEELSRQRNPQGSNAQRIGDLFALGMDTARLNREGITPILNDLATIQALSTLDDVVRYIKSQHQQGFMPFFGLFAAADLDNSRMNIAHISQPGLGMGDRDLYLQDDERSIRLREAYRTFLTTTFELAGFSNEQALQMTEDVMHIETEIARVTMPRIELRDPRNTFNKMTVRDLQRMTPVINWREYFDMLGLTCVEELNVRNPIFFRNLTSILRTNSIGQLRSYLTFNLLRSAGPFLSTNFGEASFEYFGRALQGTEAEEERWKTVVSTLDGVLGEAVGKKYVARYFPPIARQRMEELVQNLLLAMADRIDGLEWMSDETKEQAHLKLSTMRVLIGYPKEWMDYSEFVVNAADSYLANMRRGRRFHHNRMLADINSPVDLDRLLMNPHTVNAYYMATTNTIGFPAGILQPPFFFMHGDDALNYGAIGMVIGHEITHGFDDQGRRYDKLGNLTDWWTREDEIRFNERTQILVDFFNAIEVAPGVFANGVLTLGENISDNGGLAIAYSAFQRTEQYRLGQELQGFTPSQRFFIAYATVWAGNIRERAILTQTQTGVHSLPRWRVNGAVPHSDAFHNAFNTQPGDGMWLAPENRARIW